MRLDILSPCGLLIPGKKKRDFTQSKASKQAWNDANSSARFSLPGLSFADFCERQNETDCPSPSSG
jgi:hypothetical protein